MAATADVIQLEDGWSQIKEAVQTLEKTLDGGSSKYSNKGGKLFPKTKWAQIYTLCYNMCTQRPPNNWSDQLYSRHRGTIEAYLKDTVLPALMRQRNEYLLKELATRWDNHMIMNRWLFRFFMYLDRYFVEQHNLPPLRQAGLEAFRLVVFDEVCPHVLEAVAGVIDKERDGELIDRSLLKKCAGVFEALGQPQHSLQFYYDTLQKRVVNGAREYYTRKASAWLASLTTPQYLLAAEEALNAERDRVTSIMHHTSESAVLRVVEETLLEKHERALLDKAGSGCRVLLRNQKLDDLARMYRLFARITKGLVNMARITQEYMQEQGLAIVRAREADVARTGKENPNEGKFVKALLQLHESCKQLVDDQFQGNSLFQKAMKDAFELVVNKDVNSKYTNAEMISIFCDRILRSGGERLSEEQVEDLLERLVQLFSYISDKDLFAHVYRKQLSKRLLNQRSASDDAERSLLLKLKLRCGAMFTGKMEGMMADLRVGTAHQKEFEEYMAREGSKPKFAFKVQVLTTGFWPFYKQLDAVLPPEMQACQKAFQSFYDSKTSHRKLQWVKAFFPKDAKDLQVTTLQCVVLLLFNATPGPMAFKTVREAINCDEDVTKRLLHSLSCGKYKVLRKEPAGRTISPSDSFKFNDKFKCSYRKVRIPMSSLDDSDSPKRVDMDRSIAIEASVVRIMKTRKVFSHQELVTEVLKQLHLFRPNPKVIKRRIEHLIEREYLERDEAQPNVYKYVA